MLWVCFWSIVLSGWNDEDADLSPSSAPSSEIISYIGFNSCPTVFEQDYDSKNLINVSELPYFC